eukprot:scaffold2447_cov110-Cylindrotheca_fusiformis.AAC.4
MNWYSCQSVESVSIVGQSVIGSVSHSVARSVSGQSVDQLFSRQPVSRLWILKLFFLNARSTAQSYLVRAFVLWIFGEVDDDDTHPNRCHTVIFSANSKKCRGTTTLLLLLRSFPPSARSRNFRCPCQRKTRAIAPPLVMWLPPLPLLSAAVLLQLRLWPKSRSRPTICLRAHLFAQNAQDAKQQRGVAVPVPVFFILSQPRRTHWRVGRMLFQTRRTYCALQSPRSLGMNEDL